MSDQETYSTAGPICPYCKIEHTPDCPEYFDETQSEMQCGFCEKTFKIDVFIETSWACEPLTPEPTGVEP